MLGCLHVWVKYKPKRWYTFFNWLGLSIFDLNKLKTNQYFLECTCDSKEQSYTHKNHTKTELSKGEVTGCACWVT